MNSWLIMKHSKVPAQSDREPVDDLDNRDKADSKAKAAKSSEARDEVEPRHFGGPLKLCKERRQFIDYFFCELVKETGKPSTDVLPKKMLTTATSLS